jgi:hypothetical protein
MCSSLKTGSVKTEGFSIPNQVLLQCFLTPHCWRSYIRVMCCLPMWLLLFPPRQNDVMYITNVGECCGAHKPWQTLGTQRLHVTSKTWHWRKYTPKHCRIGADVFVSCMVQGKGSVCTTFGTLRFLSHSFQNLVPVLTELFWPVLFPFFVCVLSSWFCIK